MVLGSGVHQVGTTTNVLAVTLGDKLKRQLVATGGDTICARVVRALQNAVGRASLVIGTEGGIPLVSGIAICVAVLVVNPAPVGVCSSINSVLSCSSHVLGLTDDNLSFLCAAARRSSAGLPGQRRMSLGFLSPDTLGAGTRDQKAASNSELREHLVDGMLKVVLSRSL